MKCATPQGSTGLGVGSGGARRPALAAALPKRIGAPETLRRHVPLGSMQHRPQACGSGPRRRPLPESPTRRLPPAPLRPAYRAGTSPQPPTAAGAAAAMVGQSSGPALPFHKLFTASAIAACTAEITTLPLGARKGGAGCRVCTCSAHPQAACHWPRRQQAAACWCCRRRSLRRRELISPPPPPPAACCPHRHGKGQAAAAAQERDAQVPVSGSSAQRRRRRRPGPVQQRGAAGLGRPASTRALHGSSAGGLRGDPGPLPPACIIHPCPALNPAPV